MISRLTEERGAAAVEFALVFPLLIVILLGIIEFGAAYNAQIELTGAAREAARTMAVQNSATDARQTAKDYAVLNPALADGDIAITPTTCSAGATARVQISYQHHFITGMFGATIPLTGQAAMRCGG